MESQIQSMFQTTNQIPNVDNQIPNVDSQDFLVGGIPTPLKNDGVNVSWDDDIPFPTFYGLSQKIIPRFLWKITIFNG